MKRIVLTGGGTAGHVTPHMAILPHLLKEGYDIHYIGTENGIEHGMIAALPGVTYHAVKSGKLNHKDFLLCAAQQQFCACSQTGMPVRMFQHIMHGLLKPLNQIFPIDFIGVHFGETRAHVVDELELLHVFPCFDIAAENAFGSLVVCEEVIT